MSDVIELNLGWKKDRYDPKPRLYSAVKPRKITIPEHSGLEPYRWSVRSQGDMGACVGFSFAGQLTGIALKLGIYTDWFSPQFIWNGARFMEGALTQNEGVYPSDAITWMQSKGALLEQYWPFSSKKLDMRAPWSALDAYAAMYPIISATRVDNGSQGILEALATGHFISMGTPWSRLWFDKAPSSGVLPYVDGNSNMWMTGGHASALYDYSLSDKVFYGINSWGNWGKNGLFTIQMREFDEAFKQLGGYDAFFLNVDWNENNPIPNPPKGCFVIQGLRKLFGGS